jgi:hypothetical protein
MPSSPLPSVQNQTHWQLYYFKLFNCMANLNRLFAAELSSGLIVAPQVDEGTLLAHTGHVLRAEKG